jgi:predicted RNA binding protein YcfA (HicA-like mRNA interferase family)
MSEWSSTRARRVLAALLRMGWIVKRQSGSHRTLSRIGWPDFVFAFHDTDQIGRGCLPALQNGPGSVLKTCRFILKIDHLTRRCSSQKHITQVGGWRSMTDDS